VKKSHGAIRRSAEETRGASASMPRGGDRADEGVEEVVLTGFMTMNTVADGHRVAVRISDVRALENVHRDDSGDGEVVGVQVSMADGSTYVVRGSVDELLKSMEDW